MSKSTQAKGCYEVDLTAAAGNLISLPSFTQTLQYTAQQQVNIGHGSTDFSQFKFGSSSTNTSTEQNRVFEIKQEQEPKVVCFSVPAGGECFTIYTEPVEIIDQMQTMPNQEAILPNELNLKLERPDNESLQEELDDDEEMKLSEDLFASFNISSCDEDMNGGNDLLDFGELAATIPFISSPDDIMEDIQNAVDFSSVSARNGQLDVKNMLGDGWPSPGTQNIISSRCLTPDTITASSTSSPNRKDSYFSDMSILGSFPEGRIQELHQHATQNFMSNSMQQYQRSCERLTEQKPLFKPITQGFNLNQQIFQQQTLIKVEKQENSFNTFMLMQNITQHTATTSQIMPNPFSTVTHAQPPSIIHATHMPPQHASITYVPPPPYLDNISPLSEKNFAPYSSSVLNYTNSGNSLTSFDNFSNSLKPFNSFNLNAGLENMSKTSTPIHQRKPRKKKSDDKIYKITDPPLLRNIQILLSDLGLPPNYQLEFVNEGHGVKNPKAVLEKSKKSSRNVGGSMVNAATHDSNGVSPLPTSFTCNFCFKKFDLQRLLNRHLKSHSVIKRYLCIHCLKGFNDSFDLKRHTRTHTGIRPFRCEFCEKTFTQRCSLESHRMKVHNVGHTYKYKQRRDKMYICEMCGITTRSPEVHYLHLQSNHPNSSALYKFHDKRYFKFTDSQFAESLLRNMSSVLPMETSDGQITP